MNEGECGLTEPEEAASRGRPFLLGRLPGAARGTRPSIVRRTGHHCAELSHRRVKMYAPSERRITLKQWSHHARENEHDTSTQCNRWAGKRSVPRDGRGTDGDGESAARKVSAWLASELDAGRESAESH